MEAVTFSHLPFVHIFFFFFLTSLTKSLCPSEQLDFKVTQRNKLTQRHLNLAHSCTFKCRTVSTCDHFIPNVTPPKSTGCSHVKGCRCCACRYTSLFLSLSLPLTILVFPLSVLTLAMLCSITMEMGAN